MHRILYLSLLISFTVFGTDVVQAAPPKYRSQVTRETKEKRRSLRGQEKSGIDPRLIFFFGGVVVFALGLVFIPKAYEKVPDKTGEETIEPSQPSTPKSGGNKAKNMDASSQPKPAKDEPNKKIRLEELKQRVLQHQDDLKNNREPSKANKQISILYEGENFDVDVIESDYSQYRLGAIGACTVNAFEAGILFKLGYKPSVTFMNYVVSLAALYSSDEHTGFDDIASKISRYSDAIERYNFPYEVDSEQVQAMTNNMEGAIKKVVAQDMPITVVVTKPPESIFFHVESEDIIYLCDSHPRPRPEIGIDSSYTLVFTTKIVGNKKIKALDLMMAYVKKLFPYQKLKGFNDLRAQQVNMISFIPFKLKKDAKEKLKNLDKESLDKLAIEFEKLAEKLKEQRAKNQGLPM